jgi:hypothetical protein
MDLKALWKQTRQDFVAEAARTVPLPYRCYAEAAATWVYDNLGTSGDALSRVSSLAAFLLEHEGQSTLPLTASDFALSDLICERARPMAQAIHREVFGRARVPFKDMATAIEWLEREAQSRHPKDGLGKEARGLVTRAAQLAQKAHASGLRMEIGLSKPFLYYPSALPTDPPGPRWARPVDATFSRKLRLLSARIDTLAEKTGWHKANALMFVLAGAKPLTPRFQLRDRSSEIRQWWELEIGSSMVSRDDLTKIMTGLKPKEGRKRPLTDKGIAVHIFVSQYRPAKTWPWILAEWNRQHPAQAYRTVRGLRMAYGKLLPGARKGGSRIGRAKVN